MLLNPNRLNSQNDMLRTVWSKVNSKVPNRVEVVCMCVACQVCGFCC